MTAAPHLGLTGQTMRQYLEHSREVLLAARREGARVGDCKLLAFIVYRPACKSFDGRLLGESFGFVAYETQKLLAWKPSASTLPAHLCLYGRLLQVTRVAEPESLRPLPEPVQATVRDRWKELKDNYAKQGWVKTWDFCKVFEIGTGNCYHAAHRVNKRLRGKECEVADCPLVGAPPTKKCRVVDLKRCYPDLM